MGARMAREVPIHKLPAYFTIFPKVDGTQKEEKADPDLKEYSSLHVFGFVDCKIISGLEEKRWKYLSVITEKLFNAGDII